MKNLFICLSLLFVFGSSPNLASGQYWSLVNDGLDTTHSPSGLIKMEDTALYFYTSQYIQFAPVLRSFGHIYTSSDPDQGWTELNHPSGDDLLSGLHEYNGRLFVRVRTGFSSGDYYYSDDYGQNWSLLSGPFSGSGYSGIRMINHQDTLFASAIDMGVDTMTVWKSTDKGMNWTSIAFSGIDGQLDQSGAQYMHSKEDTLFMSYRTCVFCTPRLEMRYAYSTDMGKTWTLFMNHPFAIDPVTYFDPWNSLYYTVSSTDPNTQETTYTHYIRTDTSNADRVLDISGTSIIVINAMIASEDYILVNAQTSDDAFSKMFKIINEPPASSSKELDQSKVIQVYPNPVNDELNILSNEAYRSMEILNLNGQTIMKLDPRRNSHHISDIPTGIYLLSARSTDRTIIRKFIKGQ